MQKYVIIPCEYGQYNRLRANFTSKDKIPRPLQQPSYFNEQNN